MKPREYCCCAIPLVNAGIYVTLFEQFGLGLLVGILGFATPSIVGASTPSFAPLLLGILCFIVSALQILGFIGVLQEKPTLYRRYVTLHGLVASAAFAVAAAWTIMSATGHSNAKSRCLTDFFSSGDLSGSGQAETLCNIFPWVDVGIMGGLWVILAILHVYLFFVLSSYATSQQRDHDKYDQLYDPTRPLTSENIPMNNRGDPWDSRPSTDSLQGDRNGAYTHVRQFSTASASDVLSEPQQQPKDGLADHNYGYNDQTSYPPYSDAPGSHGPAYPSYAYTQDPVPTPHYNDTHYGGPSSDLDRPSQVQAHPGESNLGR